jgi:hypothetical protein
VAVFPFAQALADLVPHIGTLQAERDALTARMLAHPDNLNFAAHAKPKEDRQAAALDLLREVMNGSSEGHAALKHKARERYVDLSDKRDDFDRAIAIAQKLYNELTIKARAELGEARRADYDALLKQKAHALIALEQIEQAIEKTVKGTDMAPYTLAGSSRLRVASSPVRKFLEWCTSKGIISEREFTSEVERARGET